MSILRAGRMWGFAAWATLAAVTIVLLAVANRGGDLTIRLYVENGASQGQVVVYYDDGAGYREQATVRAPAKKGMHRYEFRLPVTRIKGFRIDPATNDEATRIAEVEATSGGSVIKRFGGDALVPANDIESWQVEAGGRAVRFVVRKGGRDPFFMVSGSACERLAACAGA